MEHARNKQTDRPDCDNPSDNPSVYYVTWVVIGFHRNPLYCQAQVAGRMGQLIRLGIPLFLLQSNSAARSSNSWKGSCEG